MCTLGFSRQINRTELIESKIIKLRPEGNTNLRAAAFVDRDLEINRMTLKLEGDLYILKIFYKCTSILKTKLIS